jgi:IGR protein motif
MLQRLLYTRSTLSRELRQRSFSSTSFRLQEVREEGEEVQVDEEEQVEEEQIEEEQIVETNIDGQPILSPEESKERVRVFLKAIGRGMIEHADAFESFEELLAADRYLLKGRDVPVAARRYIFAWREKYRRGWFYPGDVKRSIYEPREKRVRQKKPLKHRKKKMMRDSLL